MQLQLEFEAGHLARFPQFGDAIRASVYGCGRPFKAIAAELDMSSSELSRRLADGGDVRMPAERLAELIEATGDLGPIYWLCERFAVGEGRQAAASRVLEELARLLPEVRRVAGGGA